MLDSHHHMKCGYNNINGTNFIICSNVLSSTRYFLTVHTEMPSCFSPMLTNPTGFVFGTKIFCQQFPAQLFCWVKGNLKHSCRRHGNDLMVEEWLETYRNLGKMAVILHITFSNIFSWVKMFEFDWNFTEVCPLRSNQWYVSIDWDSGLAPNGQQVIIVTIDGLNCGLTYWGLTKMTDTYHSRFSMYCVNSNISLNHYWPKQEGVFTINIWLNGLVQERHNSTTYTLELHLSLNNPSNVIYLNCYLVTSQIH